VLLLLLLGAELQQRRPDHLQAKARERHRQAQPRELLAQDLGVRCVEPAAAVLLRPRRRRQSTLGHHQAVALALGMRQLGLAPAPKPHLCTAAAAQTLGHLTLEKFA
jgi:hypothetical protein